MAGEFIGELMFRFSISRITSLPILALYNIMDQVFTSHGVGFFGNGATDVVFLITIITLAISLLVGDGCVAYLGIHQRRMDAKNARKNVGNTIGLITVSGILLTLVFTLLRDGISTESGATVNSIEYVREYFSYLILDIPFFMSVNFMNSIIRAGGSPRFVMSSTLTGRVINVALGPVAIFVPEWGMKGAALATTAGRIVSTLLAVYYLTGIKSFRLKSANSLPGIGILKHTLPLRTSSLLTQISIVITMAVVNNMLVFYEAQSKYDSDIPLTVVGIVIRMFRVIISIMVGIATGVQPIVEYNCGVDLWHQVKYIFCTMMIAEFCVGLVSLVYFEAFPIQIISLFENKDGLYNEPTVLVFRIFLSGIVPCYLQKIYNIFFQSIDGPALSVVLSLLRDFALGVSPTPFSPRLLGITRVLYSGPITDAAASGATMLIIGVVLKKLARLVDRSEAERHRGTSTTQAILPDIQKIS